MAIRKIILSAEAQLDDATAIKIILHRKMKNN